MTFQPLVEPPSAALVEWNMARSESFKDKLARLVFQRSLARRDCSHLNAIAITDVDSDDCAGCFAEGTRTVRLRMCLTCGYPGCCDSSTARHAKRHHDETGHPLIRSAEPGEQWVWCYPDEAYLPTVLDQGR